MTWAPDRAAPLSEVPTAVRSAGTQRRLRTTTQFRRRCCCWHNRENLQVAPGGVRRLRTQAGPRGPRRPGALPRARTGLGRGGGGSGTELRSPRFSSCWRNVIYSLVLLWPHSVRLMALSSLLPRSESCLRRLLGNLESRGRESFYPVLLFRGPLGCSGHLSSPREIRNQLVSWQRGERGSDETAPHLPIIPGSVAAAMSGPWEPCPLTNVSLTFFRHRLSNREFCGFFFLSLLSIFRSSLLF